MAVKTQGKTMDPRVRRTRQLLQQVFIELLKEKSFHAITVLDIAERATVNRATFYAHFRDKYDLLDAYILESFQRRVSSRLATSSSLNRSTFRLLILAVFEYLALVHSGCRPDDRQIEPFFETIVQRQIYHILLTWLKKLPIAEQRQPMPVETIASTISWAILGAGIQWNAEERACSAQEMADQLLIVLGEGLFQTAHLPDQE